MSARRFQAIWFLAFAIPALAAEPPAGKQVNGRRFEIDGIPAVEVWGTPREAGFAQGYLLAEEAVRVFDGFVLAPQISRSPEIYEQVLRPGVLRSFRWPAPAREELEGIVAGIRARLGDAARSKKLDRELTVEDLEVVNTLADWRGIMCSSVSLWGDLTADGQTLTARNLDYPVVGGVDQAQLIFIHRGDGQGGDAKSRAWVGVTWPGLIGVYTAMNAEGVTVSIHDARGLAANVGESGDFVARSLVLREALEGARRGSYVEDFRRALADRALICGGNIHVSGPRGASDSKAGAGAAPPAAVFEWDGNRKEHGLAVRLSGENRAVTESADDGGTAGAKGPRAEGSEAASRALPCLTCTNHMRLRKEPIRCRRYAKIGTAVDEEAAAAKRYDAAGALELIRSVADETTQHSVVFMPAAGKMLVLIPALRDKPVEIDVAKLLARPVENSKPASN